MVMLEGHALTFIEFIAPWGGAEGVKIYRSCCFILMQHDLRPDESHVGVSLLETELDKPCGCAR